MLFSSIPFLYLFLPLVLVCYFLAPGRYKNHVLLISSLLFYAYGEPRYVIILLVSSLSDWLHSLYIESHRGKRSAKAALVSSILVNLLILGFFKYADFLIGTVNTVGGLNIPLLKVPLPIGVSFFTFQTMSYTIDVYRGEVKAERNIATFATFVSLFPQLIAGPIVRYSDVAAGLHERSHSLKATSDGLVRFVVGLSKKVLIANAMGELCDIYRKSSDGSVLFVWLYAAAFMLQIYFDFSGYSDMAIGLGRIFGLDFPENFNYPYLSRSVTEFWRRWHMTLSTWFRDYLYIPLGGNRVSKGRWIFNIFTVWFLTGLWHGAAWNFAVWGAIYGILLLAEKFIYGRALAKSKVLSRVYVLLVTAFAFVIFNAEGMGAAIKDVSAMVGLGNLPLVSASALYYLRSYMLIFVLAIIGATPLMKNLINKFKEKTSVMTIQQPLSMTILRPLAMAVIQALAMVILLVAVTASLVDGSFNPFLYFRF